MLISKLIFSLDSEWTNKIMLPTPDNSVCFVLFRHIYLGNTGNLTLCSHSRFDYVE